MSARSVISRNAQLTVSGLISALCSLYAVALPPRYRYAASLLASRGISATFGRYVSNKWNIGRSSQTARLLHRFLDRMASRKFVPMPIVLEGENILQRFCDEPGGFLCCTAHLPFANLLGHHLHAAIKGTRPICIVSSFPNAQNAVDAWNGEPVEAIFLDGNVLLHIRRALRKGACVVVLLDKEQGQPVSPNLFHFAARCNVKSLGYLPALLEDGRIKSRFVALPHEICEGEQDVAANVRFFEDEIDTILGGGRHVAQPITLRYPSALENHQWVDSLPTFSSEKLLTQREQILVKLKEGSYRQQDRFFYGERVRIIDLELKARAVEQLVAS
jgi:hypothetical protein